MTFHANGTFVQDNEPPVRRKLAAEMDDPAGSEDWEDVAYGDEADDDGDDVDDRHQGTGIKWRDAQFDDEEDSEYAPSDVEEEPMDDEWASEMEEEESTMEALIANTMQSRRQAAEATHTAARNADVDFDEADRAYWTSAEAKKKWVEQYYSANREFMSTYGCRIDSSALPDAHEKLRREKTRHNKISLMLLGIIVAYVIQMLYVYVGSSAPFAMDLNVLQRFQHKVSAPATSTPTTTTTGPAPHASVHDARKQSADPQPAKTDKLKPKHGKVPSKAPRSSGKPAPATATNEKHVEHKRNQPEHQAHQKEKNENKRPGAMDSKAKSVEKPVVTKPKPQTPQPAKRPEKDAMARHPKTEALTRQSTEKQGSRPSDQHSSPQPAQQTKPTGAAAHQKSSHQPRLVADKTPHAKAPTPAHKEENVITKKQPPAPQQEPAKQPVQQKLQPTEASTKIEKDDNQESPVKKPSSQSATGNPKSEEARHSKYKSPDSSTSKEASFQGARSQSQTPPKPDVLQADVAADGQTNVHPPANAAHTSPQPNSAANIDMCAQLVVKLVKSKHNQKIQASAVRNCDLAVANAPAESVALVEATVLRGDLRSLLSDFDGAEHDYSAAAASSIARAQSSVFEGIQLKQVSSRWVGMTVGKRFKELKRECDLVLKSNKYSETIRALATDWVRAFKREIQTVDVLSRTRRQTLQRLVIDTNTDAASPR
ncbi:TPA: hypothetical protein N0F65_006899 [Lagenidium giganteum]|uniref:Uncharacterized protein n=1 Tax=Lagenidium giganteum TaxID=4803 RepID=A0AAV2ZE02_9STRA|nr:TPA: hypothetical protein N0F65_006899 [Lagenidium giganteum]